MMSRPVLHLLFGKPSRNDFCLQKHLEPHAWHLSFASKCSPPQNLPCFEVLHLLNFSNSHPCLLGSKYHILKLIISTQICVLPARNWQKRIKYFAVPGPLVSPTNWHLTSCWGRVGAKGGGSKGASRGKMPPIVFRKKEKLEVLRYFHVY